MCFPGQLRLELSQSQQEDPIPPSVWDFSKHGGLWSTPRELEVTPGDLDIQGPKQAKGAKGDEPHLWGCRSFSHLLRESLCKSHFLSIPGEKSG